MKLSEAIRLGAMMKPQVIGRLVDDSGTCAMGAAIEAAGGYMKLPPGLVCTSHARPGTVESNGEEVGFTIPQEWMPVTHEKHECPECSVTTWGMYVISKHLNDSHRWTRERIAGWVETIENQQAPESTPQQLEQSVRRGK